MTKAKPADRGCVIIWQYDVRPGSEPSFERTYGTGGEWHKIFASAEGYIRTELSRHVEIPGRYHTFDFWVSREAYERFHRQTLAAYEALDKRCEAWTRREVQLGVFEKVG